MLSFKEYFLENNKKNVLSPKEIVEIVGIGKYNAKVDTGNDLYNVLHGEEIRIDGESVSFKTSEGKLVKKPLIDTITINIGAGKEEKRPIVELDFIINGKMYKNQKFTIGDRKDNDEKVLIGLKFLEPLNAIVKC